MICLCVNALLCKVQYIVIHAMPLSGVNSPPPSPDLSTCDFYLWGYLKGKLYAYNAKTLEDLKENIRTEILRIDTAELHRVYDNMLQRAQKCIDVQGDHFQHLL